MKPIFINIQKIKHFSIGKSAWMVLGKIKLCPQEERSYLHLKHERDRDKNLRAKEE